MRVRVTMLLKDRARTAKKYRRHHGKNIARSAAGKSNFAISSLVYCIVCICMYVHTKREREREREIFAHSPPSWPFVVFSSLPPLSRFHRAISTTTYINSVTQPRGKSGICREPRDSNFGEHERGSSRSCSNLIAFIHVIHVCSC